MRFLDMTDNTPPIDAEPQKSRVAELLAKNRTLRFIITSVLILMMLIPLTMVDSIVSERHRLYRDVLSDISSHWGKEQILIGPVLIVPYTEVYDAIETRQDKDGNPYEIKKRVSQDLTAVILPKRIALEGTLTPEYRFRGIYQSLVYSLHISLKGAFAEVETQIRNLSSAERLSQIHWSKAVAAVGLADPKGIARVSPLRFAKKQIDLAPGTRAPQLLADGFHAPLDIGPIGYADFELEMQLKGSEGFRMAPLGEWSQMSLSSPWAHPSFYGEILPSSRKISDKGFEAKWSIPHLVRSYPQSWILVKGVVSAFGTFSVGVRLFEPVTLYTEATRAVKYGLLFVALTFLTLVLMELVTQVRPSFVQYVIIGVALSLFFLLLIALSEHIGFNLAYAIAACTVVAMNTLYCVSVLSRKSLALLVMGVLSALYTVLFMVLRAEDFALLTGAVLLLVAVVAIMYFTRNLHRTRHF